MQNKKLIFTALGVAVAVGGWALFRPELLFVNSTVNEKLPVSGNEKTEVEAKGTFASQAHETTGTAEVVKLGSKHYLKLANFKTSNGPDVRVYLTDGGNPGKTSLPLGSLKGNIGDQFYELPTTYMASQYNTVSIWCERFAVGFGKAELKTDAMTSQNDAPRLELAGFAGRTEVTFGVAKGDPRFKGRVALVEENGKRFAEVRLSKFASGFQLKLVKKETLGKGPFPTSADSLDLQTPKMAGKEFASTTALSKDIDLWLYRSIAIVDPATKSIVGYVNLRSAQEKPAMLFFA